MPSALTYPGVYVEEQSSGVRTITGVATSITLFVGMARKGQLQVPTPIRSVNQFERFYGTDTGYGELVSQVRQFFLNGGGEAIIARIAGPGVQEASVTLQNANGTNVLELTAKSAGTLGAELRAIVDYDTPTPELTFNIVLFRSSVDANGATVISENEAFKDLSMDPTHPRFAVDYLTQNSQLVDADWPGGVAIAPDAGGFSQSGLMLSTGDPAAIATLTGALGTSPNIVVAVDGGAPVTVTMPAPAAPIATWRADVSAAVQAALVAAGQPGGVDVALVNFGAGRRALRLTSNSTNAGTGVSVVVTPAASLDATVALQLGSAAGGIEIGGYSRLRPQASGYTTSVHQATSNTFANNSNMSRLIALAEEPRANFGAITFDPGTGTAPFVAATPPPFTGSGTSFLEGDASSAGIGSLRNTVAHLDTLAASLAALIGNKWTVRRTGFRISLSPTFGSSNTGTAATLTSAGVFDIGAGPNPAAPARAANAQAYSLGNSGQGFQTPGVPGNNGGTPTVTNYQNIFDRVEREVDIFNLLCLPRGDGQTDAQRALLWGSASAFCAKERAFLLVDPPSNWKTVDKAKNEIADLRMGAVTDHAAIYWPRIRVASVTQPIDPSGTVAGVMARTDTRRGVWKAPAGLEASLLGGRGLEYLISDPDNGVTNPQAINTLRIFGGGSVVWGARTMAGFDNSGENDYRYVPVRRMALFIEESLYRGLQFAIFEPNDEPLWASIRLAAGAFMQNLFRQGAFQGSKASDAYNVRCDGTTTLQNDINLGRVNVIVSFAPLRPAEFVVLVIRQLAGQVQV